MKKLLVSSGEGCKWNISQTSRKVWKEAHELRWSWEGATLRMHWFFFFYQQRINKIKWGTSGVPQPLYKNQKQVSLHQQASTRPYMTIPKNTYKIPDTEIPQPYIETRPQNRHKIQQLKKIFTSILTYIKLNAKYNNRTCKREHNQKILHKTQATSNRNLRHTHQSIHAKETCTEHTTTSKPGYKH